MTTLKEAIDREARVRALVKKD